MKNSTVNKVYSTTSFGRLKRNPCTKGHATKGEC